MASGITRARVAGASGRMLMVAAIHVGAGVIITQGLNLDMGIGAEAPPMLATVEEESRPIIAPEPVEPPLGEPTIINMAPPRPDYDETPADPNSSTPTTLDEFPPGSSGSGAVVNATPTPQIVAVRSDTRHPLTQPPYPPAAIRIGEEGSGIVRVWVMPNGRVGDARIERSTGSQRLDAAALAEARRWRLLPATRDGVAFADWYSVRVVFRLDQH